LDSNEDQKKYGAETPSQGGDKKLFVGMGLHIVFFHYPKTKETQTSNLPFNSTNATIACLHCD
jgi:hypothetical protein